MTGAGYRLERAVCPECKRRLAVQPPQGGDGSSDVFPRHDYPKDDTRDGDLCPMSRMTVNPENYADVE